MRILFSLVLLLLAAIGSAQEGKDFDDDGGPSLRLGEWEIDPILGFQGWATYTVGHEDYDPDSGRYLPADDRLNVMLRRLRFGATAKVGERFFFKFLGAGDFVGEDQRSGTVGAVNNGGFPVLQVWDVYARYQLVAGSEALYVIGGYLRPPVGRESMSGALGVSSFEKSFSQWYLRQHLVGTGPGGAGGVYLGGLSSLSSGFHLDYRGGVFNAQNSGISAGVAYSPLFVGRLNLMFGEPEKTAWTYGLASANRFGKRSGVSLALNLAHEGTTGAAERIALLGLDAVVNYGQFHLAGEYHALNREALGGVADDYNSATWFVRTGYNIAVTAAGTDRPRYLEPSIMLYGFEGTTDLADYPSVVATNFYGGRETVIDVGLNYHILPGKVRLSLHYTAFGGDIGDLPPDGRLSQAWTQPGLGGIRRGDYLGFEVILSR